MRILAIIANIGWMGFFVFLIFNQGLPSGDELLFFSLATATLVINLIAILLYNNESESWFYLYLKRKSLEEKEKINRLKEKESK